jgi:hypothetical protein
MWFGAEQDSRRCGWLRWSPRKLHRGVDRLSRTFAAALARGDRVAAPDSAPAAVAQGGMRRPCVPDTLSDAGLCSQAAGALLALHVARIIFVPEEDSVQHIITNSSSISIHPPIAICLEPVSSVRLQAARRHSLRPVRQLLATRASRFLRPDGAIAL